MAKKTLLAKQTVTRKRPEKKRPIFRDLFRFVMSVSFKVSILIIGMVSLSLLFIFLYNCLIDSPYIKLKYIQITGVDEGIKRELIKISGLNDKLSLLTINPNEIKARMEKHPWVRSVQLEKRLPHTLVVKAEKESPRALVVFDKLFYMNRWGTVFKELEQGDDTDYPVITGISKTADNTSEKLTMAAAMLDSFESETGLLSIDDISEIHVNDGGDALIYSISLPVAVRIGQDDLEEGKSRLKRLVRYLQGESVIDMVKVIDMNYLDGAVVSFKEPDSLMPSSGAKELTEGL